MNIYPCANCKHGYEPATFKSFDGCKMKFYPTKCKKDKIVGDKNCPDFEEETNEDNKISEQ